MKAELDIMNKVLLDKIRYYGQLEMKLNALNDGTLSSSTPLSREEQMRYLKIALFSLWCDVSNKSKVYNTPNEFEFLFTVDKGYNELDNANYNI